MERIIFCNILIFRLLHIRHGRCQIAGTENQLKPQAGMKPTKPANILQRPQDAFCKDFEIYPLEYFTQRKPRSSERLQPLK